MKTFASPSDLVTAAGSRLGVSAYQTVTQHDIDVFAALTGDRQWIHVDVNRARTGPFGGPIAHGQYTLSLIIPLLAQVYVVHGTEMVMHKGFDRVRFTAPVAVGTRVRLTAELKSATPRGRGYTEAVVGVAIEAEGTEGPVCTADVRLLYQEEVAEEWVQRAS